MIQEKEIPGRKITEEYWADGEWHYKYYYENYYENNRN